MHLHEMPDAARTALVNQELPEFEPTPCAPGPALAERRIAIIPQGFCYPGKTESGDKPPRHECAKHWHGRLFAAMPRAALFILASAYAQAYHLGARRKKNLTETVRAWRDYAPRYFPTPHPSWRNNRWLKQNPWFEAECFPVLRAALKVRMKDVA